MTKVEERIILMIGECGAGKSTLIDGLMNFIFGVAWEDDYRYRLTRTVKETRKRDTMVF